MAAPPKPPQSVVLKTPKPTPAQKQRVATLKQTTQRGAPGVGGASMDNLYGFYNHGPVTLAPKPPKTGAHGLVTSPVNDPLAGKPTKAPKPTRPVKVVVHPDGKIEVHQHAPTVVPTAHPSAPSGGSSAAPVAPAHPGAHPAAPNPRPTRAPVTVGGGAPQLSLEQQAQNELDPVKAAILDAINQRVGAQQGAIAGYTKELADLMGSYAPAEKAIYGGAQAAQGAVDSATGATLRGQGGAANDALAAKLAAIDADPGTAARVNGTAASNLQGAGGSLAAGGATSLSDLISRGASAQDYGAKQKGVAGLYGLQATKTAQSQATTDTANAVATLEQQVPGLIQNLKTNMTQQQQIRFEHGAALLQANGGVVTPTIKALLGGALPVGATPKAKVDQENATTKANTAAVNAAYKQAQLGISEAKLKLAIAKEQKSAKTKGVHLGLSSKDWQNYNSLALSGARSAHQGTPDGTHPPISWQQFLTIGLGEKIPIAILIAQGKKVYSQAEIEQGLIPGKG